MKLIKAPLVVLLSTFAIINPAMADFSVSVDYSRLSDLDADFNVATVGIAYEFSLTQNISILPVVKYGVGIGGSEEFLGTEVDVNYYAEAMVRTQYQFNDAVYGYAQLGYAELEVEFFNSELSQRDFGGGVGLGYSLGNGFSVETSYQDFDSTKVFSVGARYRF